MHIETFSPQNIGPFTKGFELKLERDVTVIVGPNDCGKSALLKAIQIALQGPMKEADVHVGEFLKSGSDWQSSMEIRCSMKMVASERDENAVSSPWASGTSAVCLVHCSPSRRSETRSTITSRGQTSTQQGEPRGFPRVFQVQVNEDAPLGRSTLGNKKAQLDHFGKIVGEGRNPSFDGLTASALRLTDRTLSQKASERILKSFGPLTGWKFDCEWNKDDKTLEISIEDDRRIISSIDQRGSGVRRVIAGILQLEQLPDDADYVVLWDEPERGLHPDYQRALRKYLLKYAKDRRFQVVYSTHSPSMIDGCQPSSIRILRRRDSESASPTVASPSNDSGMARIRESIGLLPSDSLSIADVALVVEGDSEFRISDSILRELTKRGIEDVESRISVVVAGGDRVGVVARTLHQLGRAAVVLLDGDKSAVAAQIRGFGSSIRVAEMAPGTEIESYVDRDQYIRAAIRLCTEPKVEKDPSEMFDEWIRDSGSSHSKKMISKQVTAFVYARGGDFKKQDVLKACVDAAGFSASATWLNQLANEVKELL